MPEKQVIDGIRKITKEQCQIYYIDYLSDALKGKIRDQLTSICYGSINANSGIDLYSYRATVKEFLKRYKENVDNRNKGMIGELLFHILMTEDDLLPASAFFNTEERSFKKGFDVVFYDDVNKAMWFAEVKSGEKQANQDTASKAIVNLLNTAKNDLKKRLNHDNNQLWLNAINHARLAIEETKDEKQVIINLLGKYANDAEQGSYISKDKNVILVGVLFHPLQDEINVQKIVDKHKRIRKEEIFNDLITVAIQKSTYEAVVQFLESETDYAE